MLDPWRRVFRASAPLLPRAGLVALRQALELDDCRLITGASVSPPPLEGLLDFPPDGACPIGYCHWQSHPDPEAVTVGWLERAFAETCLAIDEAVAEPAGCRHFMQFVDETPRDQMRTALLGEIDHYLTLTTEENAP